MISVIVPVYNEEDVIGHFLEETKRVLEETGLQYEYVFIDDGSSDATADILTDRLANGLPGRLLGLSRNFGKEAAMSAGLEFARGDVVVVSTVTCTHSTTQQTLPCPSLISWRVVNDVLPTLDTCVSTVTSVVLGRIGRT